MTREEVTVGMRVAANYQPCIGVVDGQLLYASNFGVIASVKLPTISDMEWDSPTLPESSAIRYVWVKFDRTSHNKLVRLDELRPL